MRADWLHPGRRPAAAILGRLRQAIDEARALPGRQLLPVLRGSVGAGVDEKPAGATDAPQAGRVDTYTILQGTVQPSLETELGQVLLAPVRDRVMLFLQLVEQILERASRPCLRYSVGLASVGVSLQSDGPPQVAVPALDLGAFLAEQTGNARHLPSLVPYLAPECQEGPSDAPEKAVIYNLGAMGYHILTGRVPVAGGDIREILENHRSLRPAPPNLLEEELPSGLCSLLERMLAKDPGDRPEGRDEILEPIRHGAKATASLPTPAAALRADRLEAAAPPASGAPPPRRPRERSAGRPRAKSSSGLLYLPLWILLWIGLFFAARYFATMAFREFGL